MYQFESFQLEPEERRLTRDGELVSLTPKAFDTLVFLVERAGHLVEKEELMKALWPDSFVEESNLSQYIFTLRKTLGETEDGGQFIETVARKGFRFVPFVTKLHLDPTPAKPPEDLPAQTARVPTQYLTRRAVLIVMLAAVLIGLVGYVVVRQ